MAQSKKSGSLHVPLMILAFLAMGGFLYWLNIASEPTEFVVAEENDLAELGPATSVSLVAFGDGPEEYQGERVRIPNVRVAQLMGPHMFWFDLPVEEDETESFLVRVNRNFVDEDMQILSEDVVTLAGRVGMMSDSVMTAWEEAGVFTEEGQRGEVDAVTVFLDADEIEIHTAGVEEEEEDPPEGETDG